MPYSVGSIEPVGILNGCRKNERTASAMIAETTKTSTFSRQPSHGDGGKSLLPMRIESAFSFSSPAMSRTLYSGRVAGVEFVQRLQVALGNRVLRVDAVAPQAGVDQFRVLQDLFRFAGKEKIEHAVMYF